MLYRRSTLHILQCYTATYRNRWANRCLLSGNSTENTHKKTTTTYKHARTHAVKCKILMKIKRIEQTDQKTIWKIYCVGLNGIKCNLHVMLDFQRTSTKCHIALFVLHRLFPSFPEWVWAASMFIIIFVMIYYWCTERRESERERDHNSRCVEMRFSRFRMFISWFSRFFVWRFIDEENRNKRI